MIRLVASDIDGTLIHGDTPLSDRLFSQIRRLRSCGIPFLVASGRQYDSLRQLFAPVKDEILYLCQNGAAVFAGGELLCRSTLPMELARPLAEEILAIPECEVLISYATGAYILPKQESYVSLMRDVKNSAVTVLSSLDEITEPVTKIAAYCPESGAAALKPRFARWQEHLNVAIGGPLWLDFGKANKADGLLPVCRRLGISPADVLAFGDNDNDAAMLAAVGHPRIMASSAEPELLARYPHCTCVEDELEALLQEAEA